VSNEASDVRREGARSSTTATPSRRSAEIFPEAGGYQCCCAEDGFDALAKVNDHEPT
jgi:hypothetical protein